jgi:nucleotide-binding universal stress UspA family protein
MKPAIAKSTARFENILFATDFSSAAAHAIPYVKELAEHYGSNILAFHVRPPVVNPMTQPATWPADIEAARVVDEQHQQELHQSFAGIKTQILIEEGDLLSCLETAIQRNSIDLVVIGTQGRTGVAKILLGSVAEKIFRTVTCPVLTVGPHSGSWTTEPRQILYATDFTSESRIAAAYAISLAQEFHARLAVLHVVPEPKAGDLDSWPDVATSCREHLRELVPAEADGYSKPEYFVDRGDPAQHILELGILKQAGLIVLGAKPEKGVPGAATHLPIAIAHKVVSNSKCPVLTVRSK